MKIKGVKKVCGESKALRDGQKLQLVYDRKNISVFTCLHVGNSWSEFRDPDLITVGWIYGYTSMSSIKQMVVDGIKEYEMIKVRNGNL